MDMSTPLADDLVYDVGLHLGEDSAYYLAKGYRVVAFEANPDLVAHCEGRFRDAIDDGQLEIVSGAIADIPEPTITFYRHPSTVWGTTKPDWAARNSVIAQSDVIEVPVVDFTACLRRTGIPHYMKIDVEGADRVCLTALRDFSARPRHLSIESEKEEFARLVEEFDLLESLGYSRFALVQQSGMERRSVTTRTWSGEHLVFRFEEHSSGPFGSDVGPWVSRTEAIDRYASIFKLYRRFGDRSFFGRTRLGRVVRRQAERLLRRPLPGWHDTHASRVEQRPGDAKDGRPTVLSGRAS